jgi:hypothetical protein
MRSSGDSPYDRADSADQRAHPYDRADPAAD